MYTVVHKILQLAVVLGAWALSRLRFCVQCVPDVYMKLSLRRFIRAYKSLYTMYTLYARFSPSYVCARRTCLACKEDVYIRQEHFFCSPGKFPPCNLYNLTLYYEYWLAIPVTHYRHERSNKHGKAHPIRGP